MNYKEFNKFTKEGIIELLIVIKKHGLPFIILGGLFILYSWIDREPAISFYQLIMTFLFLAIFQLELENLGLEKKINKLKNQLKELEEKINLSPGLGDKRITINISLKTEDRGVTGLVGKGNIGYDTE